MSIPQHLTSFPAWLSYDPPIVEDLGTASSELLLETAAECLPLLIDEVEESGGLLPSLKRAKHVRFLRNGLEQLPSGYAALDASRPFIIYWCLMGLAMLGEDLSEYRERVITTLKPIQNKTGGFGGGPGQYSHLATTYSALLCLAIVGGDDAFELVDRHAMWIWLGRLKRPEGDFAMSENGERDMRAPYCAFTAISLLNLPLEIDPSAPIRSNGITNFAHRLPEWIGSCQTFEGGISSAPGGEAHGSYVFCALACLCILGEPHTMLSKYLELKSLIGWLSARQHAPEGGLGGRANKVVDGCYSHWIGGCWALVEAAVNGPLSDETAAKHFDMSGLFDRQGLIRYILCCCQGGNKGGLRDKPSKSVDWYHSCYNLAGLSSAQNHYYYSSSNSEKFRNSAAQQPDPCSPAALAASVFKWRSRARKIDGQVFKEEDRVALLHPVYIIPADTAEQARLYFSSKPSLTTTNPSSSS